MKTMVVGVTEILVIMTMGEGVAEILVTMSKRYFYFTHAHCTYIVLLKYSNKSKTFVI